MTDQDRADAFLMRLQGKAVTPQGAQVWKPGIKPVKPVRMSYEGSEHYPAIPDRLNSEARERIKTTRKEQLKASELGAMGHATVHSHGQHPRVLREVHYASRGNAVNGRAVARRDYKPATIPERLVSLRLNEINRSNGLPSYDPKTALMLAQLPTSMRGRVPSPRHFYVGDEGYRGRG